MARIIVDIDDTIADLLPVWISWYNHEYKDDLRLSQITGWDLTEFVKPECGRKIYDYLGDPDLYENVLPVPGSVDAVASFTEAGHQVFFVTAAYHPRKIQWLRDNGFLPSDGSEDWRYMVAKNKSLIIADIIVDDRYGTVMTFPGYGVLYNQAHNRGLAVTGPDRIRVENWKQAKEIVLALAENVDKSNKKPQPAQPPVIPGLDPNTPVVVNEFGGKQSESPYRFDLIDPLSIFRLAQVLGYGAKKYAAWNWLKVPPMDSVNHAIQHLYAYLAGDTSDDHLGHAFTRIHFVLAQHLGRTEDNLPQVHVSDTVVPGAKNE